MGSTTPANNETNLLAPRILCLHGGGTTGQIMYLQSRSLVRDLSSDFRLVFADAPFFCPPHPAILPVYEGEGPYRRWTRWLPSHPEVDEDVVIDEIEYHLRTTMESDDQAGGTGPWVGLLGFSQGAKLAVSILYESQRRMDDRVTPYGSADESVEGFAGGHWKFAVCMAGRAPMVSLRKHVDGDDGIANAADIPDPKKAAAAASKHVLRLPTIHVHGLRDEGLPLHRQLVNQNCREGSAKVIEWDGDHRIPIKATHVEPIVKEIRRIAQKQSIQQ